MPLSRKLDVTPARVGTAIACLPVSSREHLIRWPKLGSKTLIQKLMADIEEELLDKVTPERVRNPSSQLPSMWDCRMWDDQDEMVPTEILIGRLLHTLLQKIK